jgi:hypothetical protein
VPTSSLIVRFSVFALLITLPAGISAASAVLHDAPFSPVPYTEAALFTLANAFELVTPRVRPPLLR